MKFHSLHSVKKRALKISSESSPRKATRDGMELLYKVKEIKEANEYFISADEDAEDKYLKRGEFGELILYYFCLLYTSDAADEL